MQIVDREYQKLTACIHRDLVGRLAYELDSKDGFSLMPLFIVKEFRSFCKYLE
jgi:hypothetical protein